MDILAALEATAPRKGPTCSVGKFLADRPDRDALEQVLANKDYQQAHIARAFAAVDNGRKLDPQAVGRHRKGACNCEPR